MTEDNLPRFGCPVRGLSCDFENMRGRLDMPPHCCCDMEACIKLFLRIDPEINYIETFADGVADTIYQRNGLGQWRSLEPDFSRGSEWQEIERESLPCIMTPKTTGKSNYVIVRAKKPPPGSSAPPTGDGLSQKGGA